MSLELQLRPVCSNRPALTTDMGRGGGGVELQLRPVCSNRPTLTTDMGRGGGGGGGGGSLQNCSLDLSVPTDFSNDNRFGWVKVSCSVSLFR